MVDERVERPSPPSEDMEVLNEEMEETRLGMRENRRLEQTSGGKKKMSVIVSMFFLLMLGGCVLGFVDFDTLNRYKPCLEVMMRVIQNDTNGDLTNRTF